MDANAKWLGLLLVWVTCAVGPDVRGGVASRAQDPVPAPVTPRPELTPIGELALDVVLQTQRFTDDAIYDGGILPVEVHALRVLFREPKADAAFKYAVENATFAGSMFALCGLWYTDPAAFGPAEQRLLTQAGDAQVDVQFGCTGGREPIRDLVHYRGPGAVVRLADRKQSNRQWAEAEHPDSYRYDIHGGGYPNLFRDRGGW